jgi:hypothetical protein
MTRHCHAIVGVVAAITRRVSGICSRNHGLRVAIVLRVAVHRIAVTVRAGPVA